MGTSVESIIMEVVNKNKVDDLAKAIEYSDKVLQSFHDEMKKGVISRDQFEAQAAPFAAGLLQQRKELAEVQGQMRNYGQAALAASYALQDFTGSQGSFLQKLGSVQNNLPGIIMALGGPAGLTAVISGLAVGAAALTPIIMTLMESWKGEDVKGFGDSLSELKKQLEYLENKKIKLTVDYQEIKETKREITEAQKALDAFEAAKNKTTTTQQQVARAAQENVAESAGGSDEESGTENLARALKRSMSRSGDLNKGAEKIVNQREANSRLVQEQRDAIASMEANPEFGAADVAPMKRKLKELEAKDDAFKEELTKHQNEVVARLIGRYLQGIDSAREEIQKQIEARPGEFQAQGIGAEFRAGLIADSAEGVRNRRDDDRQQQQQRQLGQLDQQRSSKAITEAEREGTFKDAAETIVKEMPAGADDATRFSRMRDGLIAAIKQALEAKGIEAKDQDQGQINRLADQMAPRELAAADRAQQEREARKKDQNDQQQQQRREVNAENKARALQGLAPLANNNEGEIIREAPAGRQAGPGAAPPAAPGAGRGIFAGVAAGAGAGALPPGMANDPGGNFDGVPAGLKGLKLRQAQVEQRKKLASAKQTQMIRAKAAADAAKQGRLRQRQGGGVAVPIAAQGPAPRGGGQPGVQPAGRPAGPAQQAQGPAQMVQAFAQQNQINQLMMAAQMEQALGFLGPATLQLQRLGQRIQANERRAQTNTNPNMPLTQ